MWPEARACAGPASNKRTATARPGPPRPGPPPLRPAGAPHLGHAPAARLSAGPAQGECIPSMSHAPRAEPGPGMQPDQSLVSGHVQPLDVGAARPARLASDLWVPGSAAGSPLPLLASQHPPVHPRRCPYLPVALRLDPGLGGIALGHGGFFLPPRTLQRLGMAPAGVGAQRRASIVARHPMQHGSSAAGPSSRREIPVGLLQDQGVEVIVPQHRPSVKHLGGCEQAWAGGGRCDRMVGIPWGC